MPKKDDGWIPEEELPSWGRVYGGLVKLPDDTILSVYVQMGDEDAEIVEATIAVFTIQQKAILKRSALSYAEEPLTSKELSEKIDVNGREISIRQHICETIVPYYRRTEI